MKTPLVTIVTATLNSAAYVEKALESVRMQTYPHIEHIVVDGGSADSTIGIAKKFENVRLIQGKDKSMYDALNKGFAQAQGEILTWLDSDNFYNSPDVIARVAEAFAEHTDIIITNGLRTYPARNEATELIIPIPTHENLLRGNTLVPECVFFSKNLFERVGGLDISYRLLADYDLWIRMLAQRPTVKKIEIASATYVVRDNALLRAGFDRSWKETFMIAKAYKRSLFAQIWLRVRYIGAIIKYNAAKALKQHPKLYAWYKKYLQLKHNI